MVLRALRAMFHMLALQGMAMDVEFEFLNNKHPDF